VRAAERGRRAGGREGFTLVEVLVAMVILAIGLLALESLAIGAARQIAAANRTTEYTLVAGEQLERTLEVARRAPAQLPGQAGIRTLANGTRVTTVVASAVQGGGTIWSIDVTVDPPSRVRNVQPVTLRGSFFQ
jgi:prepilin-type N-terminal cleavage/methylation domain-containing protein